LLKFNPAQVRSVTVRCPKTKRRKACRWGNLCVVKPRLEDEGVVNQKPDGIGKCVNRTTYALLYHGRKAHVKGFISQLYRSFQSGAVSVSLETVGS
jgi:hypothetical protein